jgi:hypothetical protein
MTCAERLATFICRSGYEDLPDPAREQLKIRILDSRGCAVGAFLMKRYWRLGKERLCWSHTAPPALSSDIGGGATREIRGALLVAPSDTEARSYALALRALLQCRCTSYHFRRSL